MRNKAKERLSTLRMIMAAIKQKEVDERIELDDNQTISVLDKMAKQHRDSIEAYTKAERNDLVDQEESELKIIQEYLPTPVSDEEIATFISNAIADTGASNIKDMGKIMSLLKTNLQGKADMGKVSALVKQKLS